MEHQKDALADAPSGPQTGDAANDEAAAPRHAKPLKPGDLISADAESSTLGLKEHLHRIDLQRSAFSGALSLAVILMMAAMFLAFVTMYLYATSDKFDWHAALLVGALVAPATFITVGLLRAAFPRPKGDSGKDDDTGIVSIDTLKQLKELVDLVKGK